MYRKKISIYTGSRSDYEILKPLALKLKKEFKIKLFIGPHHFQKRFGNTYDLVKNDNFKSIYKCLTKINYDNVDINKFIKDSILNYSLELKKYKPDLVIILGDRYEVLSFVLASFFLNLKICHLHGGEVTNGSFDDTIRHMISKMADYHFVTNYLYKKRLVHMGESPNNIYNFGSLGALNVKKTKLISRNKIFKKFNIPINSSLVVITFHPETNSKIQFQKQISIFLDALKSNNKYFLLFSGCNADPYGNYFNSKIKQFVKNKKNSFFIKNLGGTDYFSLINSSTFVLGNSSSGIYEVPILKKITVNVGTRQSGRLAPKSVINCDLQSFKIKKILNNFNFYKNKISFNNLFYKKDVLKLMDYQIKKIVKSKKKTKIFYEK